MLLVRMGGWSQEKELSEYVDGMAVLPFGAVIMLLLLVLWGEIHIDLPTPFIPLIHVALVEPSLCTANIGRWLLFPLADRTHLLIRRGPILCLWHEEGRIEFDDD